MPMRLRIDASSVCQLKCPLCPTGQRQAGIGWGFLPCEEFEKLLRDNPDIMEVELSNWGEIFLHPALPSILSVANQYNVRLSANNGANFNRCSPAVMEALVEFKFHTLRIALDGASEATYSAYRKGGHFHTVIDNIRKLNEIKQLKNAKYPLLIWQFVVFGHNEHELPLARAIAESLDMKFEARLSWNDSWSPVQNPDQVREEIGLGAASRQEFNERHQNGYFRPCRDMWEQPVINWDGRLLGCCTNFNFGDFGNVFQEGLSPLLQSDKYQYAQRMVTGQAPERKDIPCSHCYVYREMQREGQWATAPEEE